MSFCAAEHHHGRLMNPRVAWAAQKSVGCCKEREQAEAAKKVELLSCLPRKELWKKSRRSVAGCCTALMQSISSARSLLVSQHRRWHCSSLLHSRVVECAAVSVSDLMQLTVLLAALAANKSFISGIAASE